jgi:predicted RNA-binding Zn-ribbon protein involved in translation (DUF1610 family)
MGIREDVSKTEDFLNRIKREHDTARQADALSPRSMWPTFPLVDCPCCGEAMRPRRRRDGKPYYVCDDCATQGFITKPEGIRRLMALGGRRIHWRFLSPAKKESYTECKQCSADRGEVVLVHRIHLKMGSRWESGVTYECPRGHQVEPPTALKPPQRT